MSVKHYSTFSFWHFKKMDARNARTIQANSHLENELQTRKPTKTIWVYRQKSMSKEEVLWAKLNKNSAESETSSSAIFEIVG